MNTDRKIAIVAGILFIVATAASLFGTGLTGPILDAPDYLSRMSANWNRIMVGALLSFIGAATSAGIAISLYPLLKKNTMQVWRLEPLPSGSLREFSILLGRSACYHSSQ